MPGDADDSFAKAADADGAADAAALGAALLAAHQRVSICVAGAALSESRGDMAELLHRDDGFRAALAELERLTDAAVTLGHRAARRGEEKPIVDALQVLLAPARDTTLTPYGYAPASARARRQFAALGATAGLTPDDVVTLLHAPGITARDVQTLTRARNDGATGTLLLPPPPTGRGSRFGSPEWRLKNLPQVVVPLPDDDLPRSHAEQPAPAPPPRTYQRAGQPRRHGEQSSGQSSGRVPPAP